MSDIEARFTDADPGYFAMDRVRLLVREKDYRSASYLMSDGSWHTTDEEGTALLDAGIVLPREAVEAIALAADRFLGHASHADTEARVLREALTVERERVDAILHRAVEK